MHAPAQASPHITRHGTGWIVPSVSTAGGHYFVQVGEGPRCSCPDFYWRRSKQGGLCKHLRMVEAQMGNGRNGEAPTVRSCQGL